MVNVITSSIDLYIGLSTVTAVTLRSRLPTIRTQGVHFNEHVEHYKILMELDEVSDRVINIVERSSIDLRD